MKRLDFTKDSDAILIAMYSIFNRDQTKLETRSAVRQNARIMDKLEDLLTLTPKDNVSFNVEVNHSKPSVLELDDADYDVLYSVMKNYKPINAEVKVIDKILKVFERE